LQIFDVVVVLHFGKKEEGLSGRTSGSIEICCKTDSGTKFQDEFQFVGTSCGAVAYIYTGGLRDPKATARTSFLA